MKGLAFLLVVLAFCCADAAAAAAQSVSELATAEAALALDRRDRRSVQDALQELGFDPGPADGIFGPQTRAAIRGYQERGSDEPTGFLTYAQARDLLAISDPIYEPGEVFNDCGDKGWCPKMVVVPAGSFLMGSPEDDEEQTGYEGPQHWVRIAEPFAIGVSEVTFAEWDSCVADGGCRGHRPDDRGWGRDQGWGRGRRPVIAVSWDDAQAYTDWLSARTGEAYRLPSETEWEYAARAGTTTRYSFGDKITPTQANYDWNVGKATEVGSFPANDFGLHDMHGNVWEWVEDCWNDGYANAPTDGTARTSGDCDLRMLRGGSFTFGPEDLRSANRSRINTDQRNNGIGFRVARTLR